MMITTEYFPISTDSLRNRLLILLFASSSLASAQTTLNFPGISGPSVFSASGQTFSFANGSSNWNVTVKGVANGFTPVWGSNFDDFSKQILTNTNLSGDPYENPTFPNSTGVFYAHLPTDDIPYGTIDLNFTFTRTLGTDPLTMYVHNGESEDESSTITTSGTNWLAGPEGYVTSTYSGQTASYVGSIDPAGATQVGYWSAYTTFASGNGTVNWHYSGVPSIDGSPSNMIAFETNIAPLVPEPSAALLVVSSGLIGLSRRKRI